MFFIVPCQEDQLAPSTTVDATTASQPATSPNKRRRVVLDQAEEGEHPASFRRRTARACDRCRLKKAKCSGGSICVKCRRDGVVCVTTLASRRNEQTPRPGYVHLIESQRDQLAQALHQVLETRVPSDSAELKKLLADMGIAIDSYDFANSLPKNSDGQRSTDVPSPAQTNPPSWDDIFNNLDEPQLEALESFSSMVSVPPVPELRTELSNGSSNPEDSPSAQWDTGASETPSSHLDLTDYVQMYDIEGGTMLLNNLWDANAELDSTEYLR